MRIVVILVGLFVAGRPLAAQSLLSPSPDGLFGQTDFDRLPARPPSLFAPPVHEYGAAVVHAAPPQLQTSPTGIAESRPPMLNGPPAPSIRAPSVLGRAAPYSVDHDDWDLQVLPDGLIYRSYLAGFK